LQKEVPQASSLANSAGKEGSVFHCLLCVLVLARRYLLVYRQGLQKFSTRYVTGIVGKFDETSESSVTFLENFQATSQMLNEAQ
jgi:hypothetical protein